MKCQAFDKSFNEGESISVSEKVDFFRKSWRILLSLYYNTLHNAKKIELYKRILKHIPIHNNKVVMDNYEGLGYGENPKYIAEELLKKDRRYRIIWLTRDKKTSFPKGVKPILRDSFRAYYECATAKAWVFNTRDVKLLEKRKGQVFLQTWHGGVALKKVEKDAEDKLTERYVSAAKYDGEIADGIIVDGKLNEDIFESSFWLSPRCERLRIGQPRIDVLINGQRNQEIVYRVRNKLGISNDSFFVLYAPTFRRNESYMGYITDFSQIKEAFSERFGKVEMAFRLHPSDVQLMGKYRDIYGTALANATTYPDVQELVIAADCVITDYSSIAYDFAIIRKPVFLIMKDVNEYIEARGVYDVFYKQPFAMNYSEEMLIEEVRNFTYEEMNQRYNSFYEKYPTYNKGNAAKLAADWLVGKGLNVKRYSKKYK